MWAEKHVEYGPVEHTHSAALWADAIASFLPTGLSGGCEKEHCQAYLPALSEQQQIDGNLVPLN